MSPSRTRNIKILGFISTIAAAIASAAAGEFVTAAGIVAAAISSASAFSPSGDA